MEYSKIKLNEYNNINIYCNQVINESLEEIPNKYKYINYFSKDDNKNLDEYIFYICLTEKNMEIFLDTPSLLNGDLLNNKYNYFISENNIILMFMRLKIHI